MRARRTTTRRTKWRAVVGAAAVAAGGAWGQAPAGGQGGEVVARWERALAAAEEDVRAGKLKRAERAVESTLDEMTGVLASGPTAAALLGRAEAVRALAAAGLDRPGDALWDWDLALAFVPAIGQLDLSAFGDAGARLSSALGSRTRPAPDSAATPTAPAPRRKKGRAIVYPEARLRTCDEKPAEVRATLAADGTPEDPRLDPAHDLVLSFVALETLRTWRFEPPPAGGAAVPTVVALRTDLSARRCRDLLATRRDPNAHASDEDEDE